jgi:hypothetical protein
MIRLHMRLRRLLQLEVMVCALRSAGIIDGMQTGYFR